MNGKLCAVLVAPAAVAVRRLLARVVQLADDLTLARRRVDVLVYFGQPMHEFTTDLQGQWQSLLTMEDAILKKLQASPGFFFGYRDTFLDEDRIEASKVLAIRGTVEG